MSALERRICEQCGTEYTPAKRWARFCGEQCRIRAHRQLKRAAEPTAALQRVLQSALTALRTDDDPRAALLEVRRELDAFDAVETTTTKRRKPAAAPAPPVERKPAPAPVVAAPPRQRTLFDDAAAVQAAPVDVAPAPVASVALAPAPVASVAPATSPVVAAPAVGDLRARYAAARAAGLSQGVIAKAIGFTDGTMLSKWSNGVRPLAAEKSDALSAYLTGKGL